MGEGWVAAALRVAVPGDRRANLVRLTPKGQAVFAEHAAMHEAWIAQARKVGVDGRAALDFFIAQAKAVQAERGK